MTTENEQHEIEELLPWHAAGTLNRRDARRVADALARDPELARRFALAREELAETILVNETLGAPSARTMETLLRKIDAEPARRPRASLNLAARIGEFLSGLTPRRMAFAVTGAALVLVLQAGIIAGVLLHENPPAGYQTASAPSASTVDRSYAMIRFAPQATASDITKFLESNKLSIAAGPATGGMYRVAVTGIPKAELARLVKRLQQDKTVDFIAPIE